MDRKQIIAILLLYRRIRRRREKKPRVYWVQPNIQKRVLVGAFYTLFGELLENEGKFFDYFRMSISSFHELHDKLKVVLHRQDTIMRDCIQPMQMLAVAMRYLGSGCTFTELHYTYRLGISTIRTIVRDVCIAIWSVLRLECLPTPTKEKWEDIASSFERRANFPHCLGAVDGKYIKIVHPAIRSKLKNNYNGKGYSSVVLMAVADSDYRFTYVDIGSYGKDCTTTIFKDCSLWKSIVNDQQHLPEAKFLPGMTQNKEIPYCLIGDEAFTLHKHLLRPFRSHNPTISKRVFNYRLSRAQRYVECTFGILTNKWGIFHRAINLKPDFAVQIVKACVVLHNFVRERDGYKEEDTFTVVGLKELPNATTVRGGTEANDIRKVFADYFLTEAGSVSWQMANI